MEPLASHTSPSVKTTCEQIYVEDLDKTGKNEDKKFDANIPSNLSFVVFLRNVGLLEQ